MEHIKEALSKSKTSLDEKAVEPKGGTVRGAPEASTRDRQAAPAPSLPWAPPQVRLDPKRMVRNRIVSFAMSHPDHVAFNLLRTRVRKILRDNRWKTLALTSPTPGCGKTVVALNLAFSLARATDVKIVLVDLDLKRPALARTLGLKAPGSIGRFLKGESDAEECFVAVGRNLVVGLNADHVPDSSELIHSERMAKLMAFINASLTPDIVLFDLPPLRTSDDALAFLPQIDAALLVVAAGTSTVSEIDECEKQINPLVEFVGVVLNKSEADSQEYY